MSQPAVRHCAQLGHVPGTRFHQLSRTVGVPAGYSRLKSGGLSHIHADAEQPEAPDRLGRVSVELAVSQSYIAVDTPCAFERRARGLFGGPCFFGPTTRRTYVCVDGFDPYYGVLKETAWRWIDPSTLFATILQPRHEILSVKYFTARISGRPDDQSKPQRQDAYIRALQHYRPEVEVYFGHFLTNRVRMPLERPAGNRRTAQVIKTEEKGSDVNLAVHLLNNGWLDAYDCALVVSNDSDIAESMRLVKSQHGKRIGLITPGTRSPSRQLLAHADFARRIWPNALRRSQLPDQIPGTTVRKPPLW